MTKTERTKMWFSKEKFNLLMDTIEEDYYYTDLLESKKEFSEYAKSEKIKNRALVEKMIKYSHFENKIDGEEIRIEFFPSEARDLILILLHVIAFKKYEDFQEKDYFEAIKTLHENFKKGEKRKPIYTDSQLQYLEGYVSVGVVGVVRNQNGELYFVDHGFSELYKKNGKWVDAVCGDTDKALGLAFYDKCKVDIQEVKWEDEEMLDLQNFVKEKRLENGI
jgi:hypothetical protein